MLNFSCKSYRRRIPALSLLAWLTLCSDFKKLTFYYYAETYIDFTNLVGDLFKVWKTRIWMSAINPASFASAHQSTNAPVGLGPGVVSQSGESTYSPLGGPSSRSRGPRRQPQQPSNGRPFTLPNLIKFSGRTANTILVPQQGMYTQSGGLMYWIPPPDQGSAPVCLGTALSPEEAAGAQARMQQSGPTGAFSQGYQPPVSTTPAGTSGTAPQYQAGTFAGGSYGQASSQYTPFPNQTNAPPPTSIPGTSNASGSVSTSAATRTSVPPNPTAPRSSWNPSGGPRTAIDRPGSGTGAPVAGASPTTSAPSSQWFNAPPAATSNAANPTRPYDPYANEFIPRRSDSSSRNGGWNK